MAQSPAAKPTSPDRVIAIVLFCALCGVLLGLGARALRLSRREPSPPPPIARPAAPADLGAPRPADLRAPAGPDASVDAGSPAVPRPGRVLWALVLDGRGQPVAGVQVAARLEVAPSELSSATSHPSPTVHAPGAVQPVGELGVLPGPLPFPEDIIKGAYVLAGAVQRGSADAATVTATTSAQGEARLFPVPSGRVQLLVSHDNRSATAEVVVPSAPFEVPSEAAALRIVLRLGAAADALCVLPPEPGEPTESPSAGAVSEGPEVAGRVEDSRGFPVSSARLELQSGRVRMLAISDGRGSFTARGLPVGTLTIKVRHAGFAPLTFSQGGDKPRGDLRLKLQPGGGVAGTVRDGRVGGLPPGAQLVAEQSGGLQQTVALGSDGRFVATGLVPGEVTLRARAPGFAPLAVTVKVTAGDSPEQVTVHDLRLELARSATLRGRVRGPDGNAAGVAITVTLAQPSGEGRPVGQALTDSSGEFTATDLPAGHLHVRAAASGMSAHSEIDLQAGDTARTELELR